MSSKKPAGKKDEHRPAKAAPKPAETQGKSKVKAVPKAAPSKADAKPPAKAASPGKPTPKPESARPPPKPEPAPVSKGDARPDAKVPAAKKAVERAVKPSGAAPKVRAPSRSVRGPSSSAKVYQPANSYAVGEQIYHPIWKVEGTVVEVGKTSDGHSKIVVDFPDLGVKRLVAEFQVASAKA
jgi:hypothetical protein